jgi:hypothetical protein
MPLPGNAVAVETVPAPQVSAPDLNRYVLQPTTPAVIYAINQTWNAWNVHYTMTTTTTGTASALSDWTAAITTSATTSYTTTNLIWSSWNTQLVVSGEASERMLAQYEAQRSVNAERYRVEAGERDLAKARAERLLVEALSPKQAEELQAKGHFHLDVHSKDGARRTYRINRGRARNVQQVDTGGRVIKHLCAHPTMLVPDADTMLAQKLWLETAEEEFLRVANHS